MDIGQRLKIAREAIGYTQAKAAQESRIGESSISDFENSKREPKFSQLSKLAEVYRKSVEFFLADKLPAESVMLWRDEPNTDEERKKTEAEFHQLCEQYRNLEILMDEVKGPKLPQPDVAKPEEFCYKQANLLAEKTQREFLLGDIPSMSLKQTLEEKFYVKIFHLDFSGSAISIKSPEFGFAILLNKANKSWRRNFDLAHELFHLLTWDVFRTVGLENGEPSEPEEKLANAFASRLLLPTDSVKEKMEAAVEEDRNISFEALDEIAREFGISLEALLWRMLYLYNKSGEDIEKYIEQAKSITINRPPRQSDELDELPERYCSLAIRSLREGKLSLMKFAKYMGISYRDAQEYLTEDEGLTDGKISISVA
jgi:Zn-dependent peptidase ImmA (M78 family)/DNA-binding XRE family transcriptional regulator